MGTPWRWWCEAAHTFLPGLRQYGQEVAEMAKKQPLALERTTRMRDLVRRHPEATWLLSDYGVDQEKHPELLDHTLEEVAQSQGLDPDALVLELNGLFG